ncbi:hypothetical protein [Spirulina subsalsa]|uniref:hypothetical protein n=1 Tax=Spirulina subsalsa TaxID=54311 RepID=UPI0002D2C181|nr:hypothetical protein [Spirulina subsalsa]
MNIEELIVILPQYLQAEPNAFSPDALKALDEILNTLEDTTDICQVMQQWLQTYDEEWDSLRLYAQENREVSQQKALSEIDEATIRQNLFELRQERQNQTPPNPPQR